MFAAVGLSSALLRAACEDRMRIGEKHSRGASNSPTEKDAKQPKASDSPIEGQEEKEKQAEGPTQREIKAALAARERLYGEKKQQKATEVRLC